MHTARLTGATPPAALWRQDDQHSRLLAGMIWALVVLMIVPDSFDYRSLTVAGPTSSGGAPSRLLWLGLLALGGIVFLWRAGLAWVLAGRTNTFFLLLVALALLSVTWSIDPLLSTRRLIRLATIVLVAMAFVLMAWHARRFQNVLRPILTLMLAGSLVFGLLYPQLAIHQQSATELAGAWRGLTNHKNSLGALSSMTLVFWSHAWLAREVSPRAALAGCALATTCLLLSRSSTSLAASVFVLLLLVVMMRSPVNLRRFQPYLVGFLTLGVLTYALAMMNLIPGLDALLAPLASLTGKDATLTGRTQIWAILAEHIRAHPFLGTGYAAYWTADPVPGTDSYEFVRRMGSFYPGSAHNGYLEVVNDLGWIGFACLLAYIAVQVRQSLQLLRLEYSQATLYLAIFFQQAITNLSESHWFSVLSIDFVIMTMTTMALARALLEYRLQIAFGLPVGGNDGHPPRVQAT
jgi:exopolysaccharide production protein ExoQ